MWKLELFSVIQILREIKIGKSTASKSAILTHFETLNIDFYEVLYFLQGEIHQINPIQSL